MSPKSPISVVIIPARMGSTRFPNKPLCVVNGLSMIERVWRIANLSTLSASTYIATDSPELKVFCEQFGAKVILTGDCATGTDRVAEAAYQLKNTLGVDFDIVFNLQGDAVLTPPWVIDAVLAQMSDQKTPMATPAMLISPEDFGAFVEAKKAGSSSGTCVVFDQQHRALYFSKNLLPSSRNTETYYPIYRHIGLYAYRFDTLTQLVNLPQSPLEKIEHLEQLRALENNIPISVVVVDYEKRTHGSIDNPEDLEKVERIIAEQGELI